MRISVNRWFVIRIAILVVAVGGGFRRGRVGPSSIDWEGCWIISVAIPVSTFVGLTYMYKTCPASMQWDKPSWFASPFTGNSQPLQLWHAVATTLMAAGLGGIIGGVSKGAYSSLPQSCTFALVGLGIWIVMKIWMAVFLREPRA
jgi:hypothetical protein